MKILNAKTHIALGQCFLLMTLLLAAVALGLVPDRLGAVREGRAALAEAIAIHGSSLISEGQLQRLEATLRHVVKRNPDLLSAAIQSAGGRSLVTVGDHHRLWSAVEGEHSTEAQLTVPQEQLALRIPARPPHVRDHDVEVPVAVGVEQ